MQDSDRTIELLAPAGDFESLEAAINNGADAVYFGGKNFNARANADNFEDLTKAVSLCHLFGVKAYLTLNTSLKNPEFDEVKRFIIEADSAGADAFIIADLALLPIIKELAPFAEVHASTQMGVHNIAGAAFFEKMGFDRIILSRETTVEDIIDIRKRVSIAIEVFVHGAICVGFSGACLLSSMLTGCSGNRGKCLQLCRQQYEAHVDGEKRAGGFLISPKDLCMIDRLDELEKAGVNSMKIEGRLKRPEYVAGVVGQYRAALDGQSTDKSVLKKLYNRGDFISGYGKGDIIYPFAPNHIGERAGSVIDDRNGYALLKMQSAINPGDGFKILRDKREIGGFSGKGAQKAGDLLYKIKNTMDTKSGDTVAVTTDSMLNQQLMDNKKKLAIDVSVKLIAGEEAAISATYGEISVSLTGQVVDEARTAPLTEAQIASQFDRLGDTPFAVKSIKIQCSNAFMTKASLNELKRGMAAALQQAILDAYAARRKPSRAYSLPKVFENASKTVSKIRGFFIETDDFSKLSEYVKNNIKLFVYSPNEFEFVAAADFFTAAKREDNMVFIKPPIFANFASLDTIKQICTLFSGIICNNYYAVQLALELNKPFVLGYNLNLMNSFNPIMKYSANKIISAELLKEEIPFKKGALYAYGHLPLMYFAHCPKKTAGMTCGKCGGNLVLKDKKGYYIIKTTKVNGVCLHTLKNGIITDTGSRMLGKYDAYIDLTEVSGENVDNLIKEYADGAHTSSGQYTLNHLIRGVK